MATTVQGEAAILEKMAKCRHFTGIQNKHCKIGVAYNAVRDDSVRPYRFPCISDAAASSCASKEPFTREEAERWFTNLKRKLRAYRHRQGRNS